MSLIDKIFNKQNIMNDLPAIAEKLYPDEIQQIHNEFECASDTLLKEANEIIAEGSKADVTKLNRLEALGFKQANNVKETKQLVEKTKLSEEQVKIIQYYKKNYPFNKFITEEQVEIICKKYNLVCGGVDRYKGFVPEKNLKEIEDFKLKNKDTFGKYLVFHESTGKIEIPDLNRDLTGKFTWYIKEYLPVRDYTHINTPDRHEYAGTTGYVKLVNSEIYNDKFFKDQLNLQVNLQICAPVKDMDISGLELTEGYKLTKKHIPDPVVLQPVKGGYLCISKWGAEASDPILLNEIDN